MNLRAILKTGIFITVFLWYVFGSNPTFASGKWNQKSNRGIAVGDHSAVVYDGKMYVFGGNDGDPSDSYDHDDLWEYDFKNDSWVLKSEGATSRDTHSAVVYDGKMYIFGGWDDNLDRVNDLWEYNFATNSWSQKTSGASARNQHSAVVYDGKMYIFGGTGVTDYSLNDLWEYNFESDTWTRKSDAPVARENHSALVHNNKMYVTAGNVESESSDEIVISNFLLEYNFTNDTWSQKGAIPFVSIDQPAVYLNGMIYIFGGITIELNESVTFLNDVWKYDISTEVWTLMTTTGVRPNPRAINSAVVYNEKMYIFGGGGNLVGDDFQILYDDLWEYNFTYPVAEIIGTKSNGIWYWDVTALDQTQMTSYVTDRDIAAGDFTGDAKADVASVWSDGLWYQDGDTLDWTKIDNLAPSRVTAGDITGDGRDEIIGTWDSGIWYWDFVLSKWTQMTAYITDGDIAAGDFTGDGKADVASCWNIDGLWYQDGITLDWTKIDNSSPYHVTAGDITGDGRDEIIGTWDSGIWYWDFVASKWTQMTAYVTDGDIAAGDFNGDGKADVASCWDNDGLWYQNGANLDDWTKIDDSPPFRVTAGDVTGK